MVSPPWTRCRDGLADRDLLLVLDNCEHVVSAVVQLVEELIARLPGLHVLATSREPLWVMDELNHRLAPLTVAGIDAGLAEIDACPAARLFRERAGDRLHPSLETDRAVGLMGEICRRVDGIPLAIELIAAMVAGLELEDISRHLDELFDLLPHAARRADGSQRSLRSTVEWSDALLSEDERRLLRRLAVLDGRFDLTAINAVCASDGQSAARVAGLTGRLVERSLLQKHEATGEYQLLETIRQYATERLALAGELDAIGDRHACCDLEIDLRESGAMMTGPERPHLEVLERIEDNTRGALERLLEIADGGEESYPNSRDNAAPGISKGGARLNLVAVVTTTTAGRRSHLGRHEPTWPDSVSTACQHDLRLPTRDESAASLRMCPVHSTSGRS